MTIIYDFLISRGFSPDIAVAMINAFVGTLFMIILLVLYKGYQVYCYIRKYQEEDLDEDNLEQMINKKMKETIGKEFYFISAATYLILFAADYFIITKL